MGRRLIVLIVVLAALASVVGAPVVRTQSSSLTPPATPTVVGAQACASCHQQAYDVWKGARHSKMLQPATPATVLGDFSAGAVSLHGERFQLRSANGEYFITESTLTGKAQEHRVEYTLGSRRIQHYLTTIDKGWIVVLAPSWDVQRRQWFHDMDIVTDRPDEVGHRNVQQWNYNCVGCHVSEEHINYRPATGDYATRWMDFGTSCERCHGPGSAHTGGRASIVNPRRLDPKTSSMICAQCHSLRNVIAPDFTAGSDYFDYFLPLLEYYPNAIRDAAYWADGRPRRFSNDAIGLWQSACFLRGGATCTSCHQDPHLPDVDRNPQLAATNNHLCTGCHQDIGANLTSHTRHRATSAGSSCVECHMPKTVISLNATMRDHTIGVPAPENTVRYAIPNACNECHKDKTASWAVDVLGEWWPNGRRRKLVARAETFTGARAGRREALDGLIAIAADETFGPLVQADAVGYLRGYADARAGSALLAAAKAGHPAIRAAAVSGLGQRATGDAAVRSAILTALGDPKRGVRVTALVSLVNVGPGQLDAADLARVVSVSREFAGWANSHTDDASLQRDLGLVELLVGEFDRAAEALEISLRLEADRPSVKFLLALARIGQHRVDQARVLLKAVPSSDPYYAKAQERLRLLDATPR